MEEKADQMAKRGMNEVVVLVVLEVVMESIGWAGRLAEWEQINQSIHFGQQ